MSKIKKYTIDEEIPKGAVFMTRVPYDDNSNRVVFYFLVEEEGEGRFTEAMRTAVIHNYRPANCKCDDCKI